MQLYLIRHGIAVERCAELEDAARPLTPQGQEKTQRLGQRFLTAGIKFDVILTSPLVRAQSTAALLHQAGLSAELRECADLAPEGSLENFLDWLAKSEYNRDKCRLALVGHQPDLGNWAEILVWGEAQEKLILKKNGVIALELPNQSNPIGQSLLFFINFTQMVLNFTVLNCGIEVA